MEFDFFAMIHLYMSFYLQLEVIETFSFVCYSLERLQLQVTEVPNSGFG